MIHNSELLLQRSFVFSRVGVRRGCDSDVVPFPTPLIEPDVRISRIRLSDRFHDEAHGQSLRRTV